MINSGDTSWLLISAALVLLMTPGLAFFYAGLVSTRSVINTLNMSFICCAVVPLVWAIAGFSLAFSPGNPFFGSFQWIGLRGFGDSLNGTIPEYAFMAFQMMFAVISPAIISGAVVGRMRFKPFVLFVALWSLLVYSTIAHWVWGPDGWILNMGALDFAGGTVVHISAGFSALVAAAILGPRLKLNEPSEKSPHNIPFVILGSSLLWFGWYGFNAGSALAANHLASLVFVTTTLATAASILTWTVMSWLRGTNSTAVGKATSAVVGLVAITPATGFVTPIGAIIIGVIAAIVCHICMVYRGRILKKIDDSLDAFICHGVAGIVGALLTGVFATVAVNAAGANGLLYGNPSQVLKQLVAVAATVAMASIGTAVILYVLKLFMDLRPTEQEEMAGIDKAEHGEAAYVRNKRV